MLKNFGEIKHFRFCCAYVTAVVSLNSIWIEDFWKQVLLTHFHLFLFVGNNQEWVIYCCVLD